MLKQLTQTNRYLRELAALRAHYVSVRLPAVGLLGKDSRAVPERIVEAERDSDVGPAAEQRLTRLADEKSALGKLFRRGT